MECPAIQNGHYRCLVQREPPNGYPIRTGEIRKMNQEAERLKSFDGSDLNNELRTVLARHGFYYIFEIASIQCNFCLIRKKLFNIADTLPIPKQHLSWNSSCPLMRRQNTLNVPLDQKVLDKELPPPSVDICGHGKEIEIKYPKYRFEAIREQSFADWPEDSCMKKEDLIKSGLFYLGKRDKVVCFSCGIGLMGWTPDDTADEEHAKFTEHCDYLDLMNGVNYTIDVKAKMQADNKPADSGYFSI